MSDVVIRAEGLSKRYRIGQGERYHALRDVLSRVLATPFRYLARKPHSKKSDGAPEFIWAIRDISFEVKRGEVVGIIGSNGAGKTTLLKILARITEPTSGHAIVHGRVRSLLEVGTGFHPELTGRENIYLNGAILGMKKREIDGKFDEIVAFAEVEKFIDTPMKHYSSGMYTRLAFAVAAHLEPEILLVDEVLAVGDAAFQKKCLGKMGEVAKAGRTVLFISHNMHAVSFLCPRTILLVAGRIAKEGGTRQVIGQYLSSNAGSGEVCWSFADAPGSQTARLRGVRVRNCHQEVAFNVNIDEPIILEMEFWILRRTRMTPCFQISNVQGFLLFAVANLHDPVWGTMEYDPGLYMSSCTIPANYLNDGEHSLTVYLTRDNNAGLIEIRKEDVVSFRVEDTGSSRGDYLQTWNGLVRPILPWSGKRIGDLS